MRRIPSLAGLAGVIPADILAVWVFVIYLGLPSPAEAALHWWRWWEGVALIALPTACLFWLTYWVAGRLREVGV